MRTIEQTNPRVADYPIDDQFLNRWSPRSFLSKEIPEEILWSLFEAARWAPSANNLQPWRFIIARTSEDKERFYQFINEFNLVWCKKAPVLALIIAKKNEGDRPIPSHAFDAGAAWAFLSLQAIKMGLMTHPMTGFDFEKARKLLEIPEEYNIQALVAIGYQGEKEDLPEHLQQREQPNSRRPIKESIFEGTFGKTALK